MRTMQMLAVAALLGSLTMASAQPPRRQGGTGGAGGPGGGQSGPIERLKTKAVAEELKISQEQLEKLKVLSEELPSKVQAAIQAETYRQLGDVLSADQIKRLKQIEVQAAGLRAFTLPDVAAALKLTDEQKSQLETLRTETRTATQEAFSGLFGGGQRPSEEKVAEARKKSQAVTAEAITKAQGLLSSEQKSTWANLVGEPFDTSSLPLPTFGGAFGGRPGFQGGQGGRPGRPQPKD